VLTHARARARDLLVATALASILLWSLTTPQPWWRTPAGALTAAGSLAGLVGTVLLLDSVWLTSRFPRWERVVGLGAMLDWHRRLAAAGLVLVTGHVVLTVLGHARREGRPVLPQTWDIVVGWPDMLAAAVSLALLWMVAFTSVRFARRRMRYEVWWAVHLYSYLALGLALLHQVSSGAAFGAEAWQHTVAGTLLGPRHQDEAAAVLRVLWVGAFAATLATVLWFRLVVPFVRSYRHDLRIDSVETVEGGAVNVALTGRKLHRLTVAGGQFAHFRFARRGLLWQAHPYSFAGLPDRSKLYLTVGGGGDYARAVAELAPGTKVYFEGPYGNLTARAATHGDLARPVLILVNGLGVTPVCSLLRDLPAQCRPVVIYRVREEQHALYLGELRRLTAEREGAVEVLAGSRDQHPITASQVETWVPDVASRHVYVCGSRGFVEQVRRAVLDLGVPRDRLTAEAFAW